MNQNSSTPTPTTTPSSKAFLSPAPTAKGTVVFIRNEGEKEFVPISHYHSLTLKDLAEEYNISSVLECDHNGQVPPRAVAYDSPSDVLHHGKHYVARRDAKMENNRVTFRGKILVQEYELQTPETSRVGGRPWSTEKENPQQPPPPHATTTHTATPFTRGPPPNPKRDREEEPSTAYHRTVPNSVLLDTTNQSGRRDGSGKEPTDPAPPPSSYVPFSADLHGNGSDVLVTLEELKKMCQGWEDEKRENERQHSKALEILENTRRVLFQSP